LPALTDFDFKFVRPAQERISAIELEFKVKKISQPSTNIHAVIGRNGVGKTTLLNDMIDAVMSRGDSISKFYEIERWQQKEISSDYFSSLVSVSFSAFDPFVPPAEQPDPTKGTCYYYIGLKDQENEGEHLTIKKLKEECATALAGCFRSQDKTLRWKDAINKLGSDENFNVMGLDVLEEIYRRLRADLPKDNQTDTSEFRKIYRSEIEPYLSRMSSGHAIVLLTITRLVATVVEKTLVLLDEPESHLHPPLLSAFVRALSELLYDRNGVAIIATHSPVVLQEIPTSCVWKVIRSRLATSCSRPEIQTFGENVGVLTREVFGLEVVKSGFYKLLNESVTTGKTFDQISNEYNDQLGYEAQAILRALIIDRDEKGDN